MNNKDMKQCIKELQTKFNDLELYLGIEYLSWEDIEIDTPVLVRDNEGEEWVKAYFAKYDNDRVYTWVYGATSWSVRDDDVFSWKYVILADTDM